jgi:hypothetical protein
MASGEMIGPILVELHQAVYAHWAAEELFSPRWWAMVIVILFSYGLCFKLLDESRYTQIMLFGSLMAVSMGVIDTIGASYVLWSFKVRLLPIIPSLFLIDLTIIPLYYMLVYQYTSTWKEFTAWNVVASGVISLVVFPLMAIANIVQLINWKYVYFWPIIFFVGLLSRGVITIIMTKENKMRERMEATHPSSGMVFQPARKPLPNETDNPREE